MNEAMLDSTKHMAELLIEGRYLRKRKNHDDKPGYVLYEGNNNPMRFFPEKVVVRLKDLLKQDDKGRITFHFNKVRQLHGNSCIKKLYKESLNKSLQL